MNKKKQLNLILIVIIHQIDTFHIFPSGLNPESYSSLHTQD